MPSLEDKSEQSRKVTIDASAEICRISKKYRITPFPSRKASISNNNESISNNTGSCSPQSNNHDQYTGCLYSPYPCYQRNYAKSEDQLSQRQIPLLRLHKEFGGDDVIPEEMGSGNESELYDFVDAKSDEDFTDFDHNNTECFENSKNVYLKNNHLQTHPEEEKNAWCIVSENEDYRSATSSFSYSEETLYESDCNIISNYDDKSNDDVFHDSVEDISKDRQSLYSLGDNVNFSNFDNFIEKLELFSKKSHIEALYFVRVDLRRLCPYLEYHVIYELSEKITPITHLKHIRTLTYPSIPENMKEDKNAQVYFMERLYAYHFELQQLQQYKVYRAQLRQSLESSGIEFEENEEEREQCIHYDYSNSDSADGSDF